VIVRLNHLPAQDDFYNATEDQVAYIGGVGSGKTQVGSDDILRTAFEYPRCGKGEKTPGIAICSNTFPQLIDGTMATFFDRCEDWGVHVVDRIRAEHKIYLKEPDAWIGVYSVDEPDKFKSYEFCYIWIDEAQAATWSRAAYDKLMTRRRGTERQRRLYPNMPLRTRITANPPWTMDHWLVDLTTKVSPVTGKIPCRLISAATQDNPFLPAEYIARLLENFDPELAAIEMGGKFGDIGYGRVFRRFSRAKHVYSDKRAADVGLPALRYDPNIPICWSHDFNVDPLCSVLFQWRRVRVNGFQKIVMYVLDVMQLRHALIEDAAKELRNRRDALQIAERRGIVLYGDATGNTQTNRHTGITDFAALTQALEAEDLSGVIAQKKVGISNPRRGARFAAANRMLENGNGDIGVVIREEACMPLVIDLERMFYKPGTQEVEQPKYKDGVPSKLLTHCFVAGTAVATETGQVPIEDIRPGAKVWTRDGLFPVRAAGLTGYQHVSDVLLSNGVTLTGTADHLIWTKEGFRPLQTLREGDAVSTSPNLPLLFSKAGSTGCIPATNTTGTGGAIFTEMSGRMLTERFRRATTFITLTLTDLITRSRIWSAFQRLSIAMSTKKLALQSGNGLLLTATSIRCANSPKSGTLRRRAAYGIESMVSRVGAAARKCARSASIAGKHIGTGLHATSIVGVIAYLTQGGNPASTTLRKCAPSAGKRLPVTDTSRVKLADVFVVKLSERETPEYVYDLTVAGTPEFFANGVLVHNCADAFSYPIEEEYPVVMDSDGDPSTSR